MAGLPSSKKPLNSLFLVIQALAILRIWLQLEGLRSSWLRGKWPGGWVDVMGWSICIPLLLFFSHLSSYFIFTPSLTREPVHILMFSVIVLEDWFLSPKMFEKKRKPEWVSVRWYSQQVRFPTNQMVLLFCLRSPHFDVKVMSVGSLLQKTDSA